jgi:hypothetical protein
MTRRMHKKAAARSKPRNRPTKSTKANRSRHLPPRRAQIESSSPAIHRPSAADLKPELAYADSAEILARRGQTFVADLMRDVEGSFDIDEGEMTSPERETSDNVPSREDDWERR